MYKIDLNSDLGEGALFDADIIPLITGANIACGFHAGDSDLIAETVKLCKDNGTAFGAHPGYPDKENFGRTNMDVTPEQVYNFTLYQLGAIAAVAGVQGVKLQHIKPLSAAFDLAYYNQEIVETDGFLDGLSLIVGGFVGLDGISQLLLLEGNDIILYL